MIRLVNKSLVIDRCKIVNEWGKIYIIYKMQWTLVFVRIDDGDLCKVYVFFRLLIWVCDTILKDKSVLQIF